MCIRDSAYLLPSTILLEIRKRAADIAGAQKTNRLPSREHERRETVQVRDSDDVLVFKRLLVFGSGGLASCARRIRRDGRRGFLIGGLIVVALNAFGDLLGAALEIGEEAAGGMCGVEGVTLASTSIMRNMTTGIRISPHYWFLPEVYTWQKRKIC